MPSLPDALNPLTISNEVVNDTDIANLPELSEWAYDFENNELLLDKNGLPYLVYGNEALKVWLFWAVITERNRYIANSRDYGTEIDRFIGMPVSTAIKTSELERTIREAIQICKYVKRIDDITVYLSDGVVNVDVTIESVYEEGWVELSVKV